MNNYEIVLIFKGFADDERSNELEKVKGYITSKNGTIGEIKDIGKRELAYEINKLKEGYYYYVDFMLDPKMVAAVDANCRINDSLIRHFITRK